MRVVTGDTRQFHWGTGTFASRGAVVAGTACQAAALAVREKILDAAARALRRAEGSPGAGRRAGAGHRRPGPGRGARRAGQPGQPAARRRHRRRGAGARGHRLLRSRPGQHRQRRARDDRRGRSRHRDGAHQALRRGPRLRPSDQPDDRRRADPGRRRPRHRQRVLRAAGVRRPGPAHHRVVHGLPAAAGHRRARRGDGPSRDAVAGQPRRAQGRGRGRVHRHRGALRAGGGGRARRRGRDRSRFPSAPTGCSS